MVGAMGVDVVQRLNAIERSRSGLKKTAAPLEVVESLDRGVAGPAGASDSEAAAQSKLAPPKRAYPAPAESPTQLGPNGLRFDFNDGCRVFLPESDHPWRARMSDLKAGRINSTKRYFIRFRLEIWQNGESLLVHDYSAKDRDILIQFPVGTLGD